MFSHKGFISTETKLRNIFLWNSSWVMWRKNCTSAGAEGKRVAVIDVWLSNCIPSSPCCFLRAFSFPFCSSLSPSLSPRPFSVFLSCRIDSVFFLSMLFHFSFPSFLSSFSSPFFSDRSSWSQWKQKTIQSASWSYNWTNQKPDSSGNSKSNHQVRERGRKKEKEKQSDSKTENKQARKSDRCTNTSLHAPQQAKTERQILKGTDTANEPMNKKLIDIGSMTRSWYGTNKKGEANTNNGQNTKKREEQKTQRIDTK